jgi:predicted protein tyrosine phosphatase
MRVLFVCSRNQWRSPTAEQVFRRHPEIDARSAGTSSSARKRLTDADIIWAEVILVMETKHKTRIQAEHRDALVDTPVLVLDIPDDYRFMDPELIELLQTAVPPLLRLTT